MYYICIESIDWADEFDVEFGELIDELTYQKYKYLQEVFGEFTSNYCFGGNFEFEDLNLLGFEFTEVTDEEYKTLKKFGYPNGRTFIDRLFRKITYECKEYLPEDCHEKTYSWDKSRTYIELNDDLYSCSLEKFKYYIDKLEDREH